MPINKNKKVNEEIDTNYNRPIVVLPESHLSILRKKEEQNKAKIRKTNLIPEKYSEAQTKRQSLNYLKKLKKTKPNIDFEEFKTYKF